MKKSIFGIALLAAAITFIGCKKTDPSGDSTITKLELQPSEVTLNEGEQIRLNPVFEPVGAKVSFAWKTSDSTVATVSDNGTVSALNLGDAVITCTEAGGLTAKCKVTVKSFYETLNFNQAFIYGYDIDSTNLEYATYHDEDFGDLKVTFATMDFLLFSEGFGYQNDGYLGGTEVGALAEWPCHIMLAATADNQDNEAFINWMGTYKILTWTLGAYYVLDKDSAQIAPAGEVSTKNFVKYMKDVITAINNGDGTAYSDAIQAAAAEVSGSTVRIYEYEADEEGSGGYYASWVPDGLMAYGSWIYTTGKETSSQYMVKVDYTNIGVNYFLNDATHFNGIELELQADSTYKVVSDEVKFEKTIVYEQGTDPRSSQSVAPMKIRMNLPAKNDPQWLKMRNTIDEFRLTHK